MKFGTETKQARIDRLEAERIAASNRKREIDRQRGYVGECDLQVTLTKDRLQELRKEISEVEKQLTSRERRHSREKARLAQMESA